MTAEPNITINGTMLTEGQTMTVRVAIEEFSMFLHERRLGGDTHGETMTRNYLNRIEEIRQLMYDVKGAA
jgi:uncharacterized protein (UPF0305 family)